MSMNQNIIWIGPTGTGKTGLATAFLIQAINHGYNGRFITFPELVEMLYQSMGDHSEAKVIKTFASYDCLLIDELGYVEVEPAQVGLFFTLLSKRHQKKTTLEFEDIKKIANCVRKIELVEILKRTGSQQHRYDKAKWHTCRGVISVAGQKFMNWRQGIGGGGAIDLVIHLKQCHFKTAIWWLCQNFPAPAINISDCQEIKPIARKKLKLPKKDVYRVSQVINYLRYNRCIPVELINFLVRCGILYCDNRGNAVFLLPGKEKKVVGAELRGTNISHLRWRGMAYGSRKDLGCFYVKKKNTTKIVLCESAIDAISHFALHPNCMAVSTSGATPNPPWLSIFIHKGFEIFCAFDSDETGDSRANEMISLYPTVKRLRPKKKDWNDVLKAQLR